VLEYLTLFKLLVKQSDHWTFSFYFGIVIRAQKPGSLGIPSTDVPENLSMRAAPDEDTKAGSLGGRLGRQDESGNGWEWTFNS
jgi:hypothetical protein